MGLIRLATRSRPRMRSTTSKRLKLQSLEDRIAPATIVELLKDINQDTNPSVDTGFYATEWVAVGDTVYFPADDQYGYGRELWKTDGTAAGTVQVADIIPGPGGSDPRELTAVGDKVYFNAHDGAWLGPVGVRWNADRDPQIDGLPGRRRWNLLRRRSGTPHGCRQYLVLQGVG
jgi:ELWxxDGT repeat protein